MARADGSRERGSASKGDETHRRIVGEALRLATVVGLEGISIGDLANTLGLSKSGLFAHFKSKEQLQLEVLQASSQDFVMRVLAPAFAKPRGEPRIVAMFHNWLKWTKSTPGGCMFLTASIEWDDRDGPVRALIVDTMKQLFETLEKSCALAVAEGHFAKGTDSAQFAVEFHALLVEYHLQTRLLKNPQAKKRAETAFERLLEGARR
jgi:AcrR family transcriptional regulator